MKGDEFFAIVVGAVESAYGQGYWQAYSELRPSSGNTNSAAYLTERTENHLKRIREILVPSTRNRTTPIGNFVDYIDL